MKTVLSIIAIFLFAGLFAQEKEATAWLINGKKLTISNYKFIENGNYLAYEKKPGKIKEIERIDLFSITDASGKEEVFFHPDTLDDKYFTVENMRSFVKGGYDGTQETKAPLSFITGLILGFAGGSGYVINSNPFYGLIIPAAGVTIIGFTRPSVNSTQKKHSDLANDDFYLLGYQESANQKRVGQAIKGALPGIVIGVIVGIVTGKIE